MGSAYPYSTIIIRHLASGIWHPTSEIVGWAAGPAKALAEKSNVRVMAKKSDLKILLMILLLIC